MALTPAQQMQLALLRRDSSLARLPEQDWQILVREVDRVGVSKVTGVLGDRLRAAAQELVTKHLPGKHDQASHAKGGGRPMHPGPPLDGAQIEVFRGGSAEAHLVPDGKGGMRFSDERQALHDQIVADATAGVPSQAEPRFVMMGGGPASGKSSILGKDGVDVPGEGEAVQVDSDGVKGKLPEYQAMVGAGNPSAAAFSHEESSYLAKRIQAQAFANRQHVVLDGTGDSRPESVRGKVQAARLSGYRVEANYVTVDTDTAVARATSRAGRTGRVVPESVIRSTHSSVSRVFPEVAGEFDSVNLFDNNGSSPKLIARGRRGSSLEILDAPAYGSFLAKGNG